MISVIFLPLIQFTSFFCRCHANFLIDGKLREKSLEFFSASSTHSSRADVPN
jgi:hypothetical protein